MFIRSSIHPVNQAGWQPGLAARQLGGKAIGCSSKYVEA